MKDRRVVVVGLLIVLTCWFFSLLWLRSIRLPVANELIDEKILYFNTIDYNGLAKKAGLGYQKEEKVVDGVTYYVGYVVTDPRGAGTLEIDGYVHCITILPLIYRLRIGPSFHVTVERKKFNTGQFT